MDQKEQLLPILFSDTLECITKVSTHLETSANVVLAIGGRKGGSMGLQPHLILRVLHRIFIFTIEIFSSLSVSPT